MEPEENAAALNERLYAAATSAAELIAIQAGYRLTGTSGWLGTAH